MDSGKIFRDFLVGDPDNNGEPGMLTKLGMTVEQFAVACGLTRASVYYYLKGTTIPSPNTIYKMAEVTGISAEELFKVLPTREPGGHKSRLNRK